MPVAPDLEGEVKEIGRRLQDIEKQQIASRGDYDSLFFGVQDVIEYIDEVVEAYGLNRSRRQPSPRVAGNRTPGGPVSRRMRTKKPRKPSAYQKWAKTERKKIVKQHPRFSFGRINQELGKRWKREKRRRGIK